MKKKVVFALLAVLYATPVLAAQTAVFNLRWTDNSGNNPQVADQEDGFNVERGPSSTGPFAVVGTAGQNVTLFTDTIANDPGNTTYCYRVNAFNKAGTSGYTNVACATTPLIQVAPTSPSTLTCTADITVGTQKLTSIVCQ